MNNPTLFIADKDLHTWKLIRYNHKEQVIVCIHCAGLAYRLQTYTLKHPKFTELAEQVGNSTRCVIDGAETVFTSNLSFNRCMADATDNTILMWAISHRIKLDKFTERTRCEHIKHKWASHTKRRWFSAAAD